MEFVIENLTPSCFLGWPQEAITIMFSSVQYLQLIRSDFPEEAVVCIEIICQCARTLLQKHKGCAALLELHYPMTRQHY
jgi:hypothetical protein